MNSHAFTALSSLMILAALLACSQRDPLDDVGLRCKDPKLDPLLGCNPCRRYDDAYGQEYGIGDVERDQIPCTPNNGGAGLCHHGACIRVIPCETDADCRALTGSDFALCGSTLICVPR